MCGITGILNLKEAAPIEEQTIRQMLEMLRHRGPDGFGIYRDDWAGMGNARLSIIDISGGDQPIGNEDGTLWVVFNGEIFNYVELRPELEARGHRFSTNSDTEVLLHLYEDLGPDFLKSLNGQFAIAIWDRRNRSLFLGRDRVGIRPIFYTIRHGRLIFGSEIKALLAYPGVQAEIDQDALSQIFTYWSPQAPHTIFRGIYEIPPGHYLVARDGQISITPFWSLDFTEESPARQPEEYQEELESLLIDATRIRLRADVPVGAYLSGGLDSSITSAIIRNYTRAPLDTFSITFSDPEFDESEFQRQMAAFLGTDHQTIYCTHDDICRIFPEVIWHTETTILRTAPAPMYLLSELVHDRNYKVVMTGEGADEMLAGYDIFKEMKIRRFWAKNPESEFRPLLLRRLYPDISYMGGRSGAFLNAFFKKGLIDTSSPYYSHSIRWQNTGRARRFLAQARAEERPEGNAWERDIPLPPGFSRWADLARAQYLEIVTFLSSYLLSSQGDRMAMANSVEGRYPFLDYRVIEFCNRIPGELKLKGMTEKWLLKQIGQKLVPTEIWQRPKRPYRAPIQRSFFAADAPIYVKELFSIEALQESGYFDATAANQLYCKAESGFSVSEVDNMALAGILSTQLVHQQFVKSFQKEPIRPQARTRLIEFA